MSIRHPFSICFRYVLPALVALTSVEYASAQQSVGLKVRNGNFTISGYPNNFSPPWSASAGEGKSYSAPEGTGSTSASAGFGALSAYATFSTGSGGFDSNAVLADSLFSDTVVIDAPGLTGTGGSVEVRFTIGGLLSPSGSTNNSAKVGFTFGTDEGDGMIPTYFTLSTNYADAYEPGFINPGGSGLFWEVPQTRTISFIYGIAFDFWLVLEAYVYHSRDSVASTTTASVMLEEWSGFTNIKDSGGQLVNNATVLAPVSNVNWTQPVPEPGSASLLAISAGLLALRRRR